MAPAFGRRHDVAVDPIVTAERIDASPEVVIPAVIAALVIGVLGVAFRKTLMAVVDELAELWRTYAPIASLRALEHRPRMPGNPWFCDGAGPGTAPRPRCATPARPAARRRRRPSRNRRHPRAPARA